MLPAFRKWLIKAIHWAAARRASDEQEQKALYSAFSSRTFGLLCSCLANASSSLRRQALSLPPVVIPRSRARPPRTWESFTLVQPLLQDDAYPEMVDQEVDP
eukprot:9308709-Karenia_brevis.AAC.1